MSALSCEQVRDLAAGFVLGALEPATMHDVRDHLASCGEPHPEMAELGGVVPYLAESVEPVEPPAALLGRIQAAIEAEVRASERTDAAADRLVASFAEPASPGPVAAEAVAGPIVQPTPAGSPEPVSLAGERARRRSPVRWLAAIAAVLAIVLLGAWNIVLNQQLSSAQAQQAATEQVLAIAQQPGGQAAILSPGAAGGPSGLAAVSADGTFALAVHGLTPTSGTEVYEAWVIAPSGTPQPVGSFEVSSDGLGHLATANVPTGSSLTVGLTREPASGATTPTLPMVVSGVTTQGG
jgi:Anti-sigma-K factor rskA/Putative zinc-finger